MDNQTKSYKEIYAYFETLKDTDKFIDYCQEKDIDALPVAPGTLRLPEVYITELKSAGLKFKTTKNIGDILNDKEFLENCKNQVIDRYGLSG